MCTSCSTGQRSGRGRKSERRVLHDRSRRGGRAVPGVGKEIGGQAGGAGVGSGPGGALPEVGPPRHHGLRSARQRKTAAAAAPYPYARRRARACAGVCVFLTYLYARRRARACAGVCVFLCFALKVTWTPRPPPAQLVVVLLSLADEIAMTPLALLPAPPPGRPRVCSARRFTHRGRHLADVPASLPTAVGGISTLPRAWLPSASPRLAPPGARAFSQLKRSASGILINLRVNL